MNKNCQGPRKWNDRAPPTNPGPIGPAAKRHDDRDIAHHHLPRFSGRPPASSTVVIKQAGHHLPPVPEGPGMTRGPPIISGRPLAKRSPAARAQPENSDSGEE